MALELIRKNGANVTSYDDSILFHSATLHKDGILGGVGNEMSAEANGSELIIKDGYAILKGRQFSIQGTEILTLQKPAADYFYYIIYAKIDTTGSTEKVELIATYATADYPTLPVSDDIYKNRNGVAYLLLYRVKVNGTGIEEIVKAANLIVDTGKRIQSIEDRLDILGFREGIVEITSERDVQGYNKLTRQGYYVQMTLNLSNKSSTTGEIKLRIPEGFRPKQAITVYYNTGMNVSQQYPFNFITEIVITPDGYIGGESGFIIVNKVAILNVGWEVAH